MRDIRPQDIWADMQQDAPRPRIDFKKCLNAITYILIAIYFFNHAYHKSKAKEKIELIRNASPDNQLTPKNLADVLDELND